MRKRYLVAAGAVALLAAGTAVAFAEDTDTATTSAVTPPRSVELPTGDVVELSPHGGFQWHPAEDREDVGYLTPPAADGSDDLITIPLDRLGAVADGSEDPRRYNVTELLRAGETDAAKAKTLSDKDYGRYAPVAAEEPKSSAANREVDVTVTGRDGKAPDEVAISYINLDTEEMDFPEADANGHATVSLPPGRYDFSTMAVSGSDIVIGLQTVTVADSDVAVTLDGIESRAVEYRVDRPAKLDAQTLSAFTALADGDSFGTSVTMGSDYTGYLIPQRIEDHRAGIEAIPHLIGTDTDDPYSYDLNFFHSDGIPADTAFTVRDAKLARVKVTYDGFANTEPLAACNNSLREGGIRMIGCTARPVGWQSSHTEYLTPGSDISWYSSTGVGAPGAEAIEINGVGSYEAGPAERVVGSAPLSFNVAGPRLLPVLTREQDGINGWLPFLDNTDPSEVINDYHGLTGTAVLERDGEELARTEVTGPGLDLRLPDGDAGRYTLSATAAHGDEYTPLALKTSVVWEFDSKPTDTVTPLDISAVGFDAEGITDGYADASKPQKFTLDYRAQDGATDTRLRKLTFEVSYDDGKTWHKVKVKVKGDKATGTLKHPRGAEFVSVRATATDDAGNKVTHSTIHTHGLR